ncbi:hypothetical protein [Caulobacter phage Cr30]|uniref:hypothetical protein n=1 Tax=Caulobacter phage Cr30 TaxID=1357714 RepID=UPI0004A9B58E|nr:hypothetical protein OZ74_gp267 [Caulobacter phage Cr30]AGS81076.1 hypothetical protein [Caulobacter phage Cr30]
MSYIDDAYKKEISDFLSDVVGVVECDSYGRMMLWKENHERYKWEESRHGYGPTVGYLADMPVCISIRKVVVDGLPILKIDATSTVVDWRLIDKWLNDNLPKTAFKSNGYLNKKDAQNFHNVLFDAQERVKNNA